MENRPRGDRSLDVLDLNPMAGTVIHNFFHEVFSGRQSIDSFYSYVKSQSIPMSVTTKVLQEVDHIKSLYNKVIKTIHSHIRPHPVIGKIRLNSEFTIALNTELGKSLDTERPTFKAIVDLISKDEDTAVIIDFKSNLRVADAYRKQMDFYAHMVRFRFPSLKYVETYLAGINENKVMHVGSYKTTSLTSNSLHEFIISMFDFNGSLVPIPRKNKYCKYCACRGACPIFVNKK